MVVNEEPPAGDAQAKKQEKNTVVVCDGCSHEFELSQETLAERPYESVSHTNVTEVVINCPKCAVAKHCYFNGPRLKLFQARLDMSLKTFQKKKTPSNLRAYRKGLKRFQVEFDRFQKEIAGEDSV